MSKSVQLCVQYILTQCNIVCGCVRACVRVSGLQPDKNWKTVYCLKPIIIFSFLFIKNKTLCVAVLV